MSDATNFTASGWKKHLEMRGKFYGQAARSIPEPVQVFLSDQELEIYFLLNVGKVVINLEKDGESLYWHEVDTTTERQIVTDLSTFESGVYFLKIINDEGDCLIGKFIR